jgi:hypothetical protein
MRSTNLLSEQDWRAIRGGFGGGLVFRIANPYLLAMDTLFAVLVPAALLAVLSALGFGLFALFRGGDFGRSYSNKLMRLRVVLQFVAIIVLVAAFWWRTR